MNHPNMTNGIRKFGTLETIIRNYALNMQSMLINASIIYLLITLWVKTECITGIIIAGKLMII